MRWTQGLPVEPLFGSGTPQGVAVAAITLLGAVNICAGLMTLRTRVVGPALGVGVIFLELMASVLNRDAFRQWAAEAVVARRALQGIPVREGEVEMMQWLMLVLARFKSADRSNVHQPRQ